MCYRDFFSLELAQVAESILTSIDVAFGWRLVSMNYVGRNQIYRGLCAALERQGTAGEH